MERLPVSEFQILLALIAEPRHGAAIRDDVAERTDGTVVLGPGTLYTSIKRLRGRGWIDEVESADGTVAGTDVRRFYALTPAGRGAAREEAARLEQDLAYARQHGLLGGRVAT
jgi:DNA-binding PadR family transcriptional regulator